MAAPVSVEMLQRVCDLTDRTMSRVDDKQLGDPTPCSDWTVQELTEHIVASTDFFADAAERGEVAEDREWPDYTPSELLAAYRHHATRLLTAFHATGVMDRPMRVAAGPSTPESCLQIAVSERLVHSWDLAVATGQPFGDDTADIAEALLASAEYRRVNAEVRRNRPPPLGPERAVVDAAPAIQRLVAFLGREPA